MTLAEDNDTLLDMIHPLAAGALVARQWNYDERLRYATTTIVLFCSTRFCIRLYYCYCCCITSLREYFGTSPSCLFRARQLCRKKCCGEQAITSHYSYEYFSVNVEKLLSCEIAHQRKQILLESGGLS